MISDFLWKLQEAYSKLKTVEEEMQEMALEIEQLQQELTNQKSELLQLTSEKGELEQHLEVECHYLEFLFPITRGK